METRAGFCPGLHLSLAIWLMIAACALRNTEAEITCASCPSPLQLRSEELQLGMRPHTVEGPGIIKDIRVEFWELGLPDQNTEVDGGRETSGSVSQFSQYVSLDGVSANREAPRSGTESQRGSDEALGDNDALRRAKRSPAEKNGWTGADAGAQEERGPLLDGHRQGRSEFRWNRDEGRGNSRQDEPRLSGSTFALTGDSAHNHAVVYWSGHNSSVSNREFISFLRVRSDSVLLRSEPESTDAHRRTHGSPKRQTCAAMGSSSKLRVKKSRPAQHLLRCFVTPGQQVGYLFLVNVSRFIALIYWQKILNILMHDAFLPNDAWFFIQTN